MIDTTPFSDQFWTICMWFGKSATNFDIAAAESCPTGRRTAEPPKLPALFPKCMHCRRNWPEKGVFAESNVQRPSIWHPYCQYMMIKSKDVIFMLGHDLLTRSTGQIYHANSAPPLRAYIRHLSWKKNQSFNPRLTGVSAERHWPGGGRITPPQANSQTNDRSETGEVALERSRRDGSKALLKIFLKGHVSGQGQVKGKNWAFQHFGSQNRQLDSNSPKLGRNTLKG